MDCHSKDAIAAERCNQADEQRSGGHPPAQSNPIVASEGVAHRNAVVSKAAAFDARHNPGGDQYQDKVLQVIPDEAYRIKERPLLKRGDLWQDPVRQKSEADEDADENEQAPASAQAPGVEENFPHVDRVHSLEKFRSPISFDRTRSEEHTSELQSLRHLVCRLLLE